MKLLWECIGCGISSDSLIGIDFERRATSAISSFDPSSTVDSDKAGLVQVDTGYVMVTNS